MSLYHVPVLLQECMKGLSIQPDGTYVDVTFGAGGHAKAIVERLSPKGKLIAFDQDPDAAANAAAIQHPNFIFIQANFRYIKKFLRLQGIQQVNGILADLGISSYQIDTAERGFSIRFDGALDMRMNIHQNLKAQDIINHYSVEELSKIFRIYGELPQAHSVAMEIVRKRTFKKIETTRELLQVINKFAPRGKEFKFRAQVFQALRIEVNDEINALKEFLLQTPDILLPQGRLVILSYHSLEDRLVKNFLKAGNFKGELEHDFYGNILRPFTPLFSKPFKPTPEEIMKNSRARSAKLRIGIRNS
ncbi:MAG: 16S rRNA (cytosine(1402)-N(4))-methyltransferase RsmH [Cytophagales bacterium]|nr:16S rRNA (cytosine(1402)-N(4))-methyltransferase RsmH [Cytophagales bacterium]MDW8385173.1 16S rRNA (cytosine(1402)-N(4))-methyltransferase RsmH [Flammeovirgaceae bacterium]